MIWLLALLQGGAAGFLPAAGRIFKNPTFHGFSDPDWLKVLPFILLGALTSLFIAFFLKRAHRALYGGIFLNAVGLVLLGGSEVIIRLHLPSLALVATAAFFFGGGAGMTLSGLSVFAAAVWSSKRVVMVTLLYTFYGFGFNMSLLLVIYGLFIHTWWIGTLLLLVALVVLAFFVSKEHEPPKEETSDSSVIWRGCATFFYGITTGCIVAGHELYFVGVKQLTPLQAEMALGAFFATLAVARLAVGLTLLKRGVRLFYLVLPLLAACALLAFPALVGPFENTLFLVIAAMGLSALFPLNLGIKKVTLRSAAALLFTFFLGLSLSGLSVNALPKGALFLVAGAASMLVFIFHLLVLYVYRRTKPHLTGK